MSRVVLTEKWNHNENTVRIQKNTVKRCSNVPETIVSDHKTAFCIWSFADRSPQHQNVSWSSSELTWPAKVGSYHAPKNTPRTGCIFARTTNPQPKPFQPTSSPPMQRNTPQCGVTKQCVAKECGAKMWRRRKMWRHQTMWRQTMWRQNVASQENVASPSNVAPNNVAPKCGATGKCGVTKQCGAKQCSAKMWRPEENAASPNNVGAKQCGATCLRNVSS